MRKTTFGSKILAVFIAVLILFGAMPLSDFGVSAIDTQNSVAADTATIKDWTTWFNNENNRYAGGVFMDKSVYKAEDIEGSYFDDIKGSLGVGTDEFGNDNFIVSLSAIGSTTEIKGYSVTPTDTMLVLDVSDSMNAANASAMVQSTNRAIETLLELNLHNRVGVVLYSGNSSFGNSNRNTATVILPLGRYTTTVTETAQGETHDVFLQFSNDNVRIATGNGGRGVRREGSNTNLSGNKNVTGGTYIQNGLYQAYDQFPRGNDTVIADGLIQEGTQRMPIIVLMSDGAPTTATTSYHSVDSSNIGNGSNDHATSSVGFLTQLTASWVKANLKTKYNGTEPRFYTLGLGTSNNATATGVLNPSSAANNAASYWNDFLDDDTVYLTNPTNNNRFTVRRRASGDEGMVRDYVNQYWSASNATGLNNAFAEIVEEIIIQSRYYSTLVTSGEHEKDGYISFTDEIGQFMEIKNIKGIHIGKGKLVTGAAFAEFAKTGDIAHENYGNGLTAAEKAEITTALPLAIIDRFDTKDDNGKVVDITPAQAQALYNNALNNGFISYTDENNFSNYLAWYADANNYYLAPYNANSTAPQGAKYIVKSYFFLEDVTLTHADSNMLYTLIRVREEIESGRQIVDANLPAALLPQVTYTIEVSGDELTTNNITSMTNDADDKAPACLLYEVGVDSDLTPYNIEEKIPALYKPYFIEDKNNNGVKDPNESYVFYTNRWHTFTDKGNNNYEVTAFKVPAPETVTTDIFNHGILGTTVAHFIPSLQNERYYFVTDTPILTAENLSSQYTGAVAPADRNNNDTSGYYHAYHYVKDNNGDYELVTVYNPITDNALENAIEKYGKWYIKAGTAKRYYAVEANDTHDPNGTHKHKVENLDADHGIGGETQTLGWSFWLQTVYDSEEGHEGYHVMSYLGNNGKVTVDPGEGIKLSKTINEVNPDATSDEFEFEIQLSGSGLNQSEFTYYSNVKNPSSGTLTAVNDVITVTVKAGETVYIDIPAGVSYEISEVYNEHYVGTVTENDVEKLTASGTVAKDVYADVKFVNNPRGFGSLIVSKDVTHPFGNQSIPAADVIANKKFEFTVKFDGGTANDYNLIDIDGADNSNGNNEFTFQLADGEDVIFTNIPEGITYNVKESTTLPAGFDISDTTVNGEDYDETTGFSSVVVKNTTSQAHFVNEYKPAPAAVTITLTGKKQFNSNDSDWVDGNYDIMLQRVNIGGTGNTNLGSAIPVKTLNTTNGKEYSYEFPAGTFSTVGTYSFEIYEKKGELTTVSYDNSVGLFSIYVTDADADGALEVSNVVVHRGSASIESSNSTDNPKKYSSVTLKKDFNNLTGAEPITVPVQKIVANDDPINKHHSGIMIGLFAAPNDTIPVHFALTNDTGLANISFNVKSDDNVFNNNGKLVYYVKEIAPRTEDRVVGMTYDESVKYVVEIGNWTSVDHDNNPSTANQLEPEIKYYNFDSSKVNENYKGAQIVTVDDSNPLVITNTFDNSVYSTPKITIQGVKTLTGDREITVNDSFDFVLYETESNFTTRVADGVSSVATANNSSNFAVIFSGIKFTTPGTKYLVIKETTATANGITTDTSEYHLTINVVKAVENGKTVLAIDTYDHDDNPSTKEIYAIVAHKLGGVDNLSVSDFDPDNPSINIVINGTHFTNTYTIDGEDSVEITGNKSFLDHANHPIDLVGGEFEFALYNADGSEVETVKNTTGGAFKFNLNFDENDIGEHKYFVEEVVPIGAVDNGITYSDAAYYFKVTVTDNGVGGIEATLVQTESDYTTVASNDVVFENKYNAQPASITFSGIKSLEGRSLDADEFEFEIYRTDRDFVVDDAEWLNSGKNNINGEYSVPLSFVDGKEGIYYLVLNEYIPDDADKKGISYDTREYHITLIVSDDGKGHLTTAYSIVCPGMVDYFEQYYIDNPNSQKSHNEILDFGNTYNSAPATYDIPGTKEYSGTLEADMFEFVLSSDENGEDILQITTNDANGNFVFEDVELGVDGDNIFYVTEKNGGKRVDNVVYDGTKYKVVIKTHDDNEGSLVIDEIKYYEVKDSDDDEVTEIVFNNIEILPVEELFEITKVLKNGGDKTPEGFKFTLVDENGDEIETVTTNAEGKASIKLAYTTDDIGKTYKYELYEVKGDEADIVYDKALYEVSVSVSINEDGDLETEVKVNGTKAAKVTAKFENVVVSEKTISFEIEKEVKNEGTEKIGPENFEFVLEDANGKKETVKTDKKGNAKFDLTYALKDAGKTFEYKLYEVKGDNAKITYSDKVYEIKVKVSLDDDHKLKTDLTVDGKEAIKVLAKFENIYDYSPEIPDTGDHTNLILWIALLFVSGGVAVTLLVTSKGKRRKTDE